MVASEVKHSYVIIIASVDGQRDVTWLVQLLNFSQFSSLDSNRLQERLAAARGECSQHVHWNVAPVCDTRASVGLPYFHLTFVSQKLSHWAVRVRRRPLIKQTNMHSNHSFDGFHTCIQCIASTLCQITCRPILTPRVKVRWSPSHLSHIINIRHQ